MIATSDTIHSPVPAVNIDHNLLLQRDELNITRFVLNPVRDRSSRLFFCGSAVIVLPRTLRQKTADLGNSSAARVGHYEKARGADSLYVGNGFTTRIGNCRRGAGGTLLAPVGKEPGEVRVWSMSIDPPVVRAFARQLLDDSAAHITAIAQFDQITDLPRLRRARQRPSLLQHVVTQRTNRGHCPNATQLILCVENPQGDLSVGSSEFHSGDIVL